MQLNSIYRHIHEYIKKKALSFEATESKELRLYRQNLKKISSSAFQYSSIEKLLHACHESQIVYLGDFHTFDQSSRNLERILKSLQRKNKKFILCLEMVNADHQVFIDSFLTGNLTEREFLESIDYHQAWRFPWNHYRPLFELAKKNNIPIMGINCRGSLKERDEFAASMLATFLHIDPEARLMVMYGEYHIAHNKIPAEVKKRLPQKNFKQTIIHQNLEEMYWRLPHSEKAEVVQLKTGEFHLQTSPPWIKYESMVYWFENLTDEGASELYLQTMTSGLKSFDANAIDHFSLITKKINHKLKLKNNDIDLEDFNLFDQNKIKFMTKKIKGLKNSKLKNYYTFLLSNHQSFKLPSENSLYCPNYSINRLSYTCGLFIFSKLKNKQGIHREDLLISKDQKDVFSYLVDQSFMGFLFSKIINPSRKCDLYVDLVEKYKSSKKLKEKENYSMAINLLSRRPPFQLPKSLNDLHIVAKYIGHLYAHYFFQWLYKDEKHALQFIKWYFDHEETSHLRPILLKKNIPMNNFKKDKKKLF
jgi:uncharacterized iron-regulated protein